MSNKFWKLTVWTPPVREMFFKMVADKSNPSYGTIAKELSKAFGLDISRNAAISFAKRNQVVRRMVKIGRPIGSARQRLPTSKSTKPPPAKKSPPVGKIKFFELEACDCRWPFGEVAPFTFCGAPKLECSPYCNDHTRVAWARTNHAI